MPAGIIPITKVLEEETNPEDYADRYNDVITKKMRNSIKDSQGMPIGVQVSTLKWKDE